MFNNRGKKDETNSDKIPQSAFEQKRHAIEENFKLKANKPTQQNDFSIPLLSPPPTEPPPPLPFLTVPPNKKLNPAHPAHNIFQQELMTKLKINKDQNISSLTSENVVNPNDTIQATAPSIPLLSSPPTEPPPPLPENIQTINETYVDIQFKDKTKVAKHKSSFFCCCKSAKDEEVISEKKSLLPVQKR